MRNAKAALSKLKLFGGPVKIQKAGRHELDARCSRRPAIVSSLKSCEVEIAGTRPARMMIQEMESVRLKCVGTTSGAMEMVDLKECVLKLPVQGTVVCDRCQNCELRLGDFNEESKLFKIFHSQCFNLTIYWNDIDGKERTYIIPKDSESLGYNNKRSVTMIVIEKDAICFRTSKCDRHGCPVVEEDKKSDISTTRTNLTTEAPCKVQLERFLNAQNGKTEGVTFKQALGEIKKGRKTSCWIWYIFPQYLERPSRRCQKYQIFNSTEALAYLTHATLGSRYAQICKAAASVLIREKNTYAKLCGSSVDEKKMYQSVSLFYLTLDAVERFHGGCVPSLSGCGDVSELRYVFEQILKCIWRDGGAYLPAGVSPPTRAIDQAHLDSSAVRKFQDDREKLSAYLKKKSTFKK